MRHVPFLLALGVPAMACGPSKLPALTVRPEVSSSATVVKAPPPLPMPATLGGVAVGAFGEGTFGPRLARNGKSAIMVTAPRADSGRRWFATALDDKDQPLDGSRHELAEAPEDSSGWAVEPVGDGFVLAFTRPSDSGEQLLVVALAGDGSPRGAPVSIARSGDDLVAVRIVPMGDGALLTWGEKLVPKGGISATGTLWATTLDSLGRATSPTPTRIAEKLSAWQVSGTGPGQATVAIVQRGEPKKESKEDKLAAREELTRNAKALTLTIAKGVITPSDPIVLSGDDALPEIDVVSTGGGRALVVWSDRREVDAHLFGVSVDVSGEKPKMLGTPKRAAPPHGDQAIVSMVPSKDGAVVLFEIVAPRSLRDPRRRFEVARLSADGESVARPRGFYFPYENDEPELARAGDDDVVVLTHGKACIERGADLSCDDKDLRPWVLRFGGPTLTLKQADVLDVAKLAAVHGFEPSCTATKCDVLVEGAGNPAPVMLVRVPVHDDKAEARWAFRDLVDQTVTSPRLEGANAVAREPEFTGLHAVRAGAGTLVGWITYAPDDVDLATPADEPAKPKKGEKGEKGEKGAKPKTKKSKPAETGARVGVRLLDASGEPIGPVTVVTEKALSKGDVAVAWSLAEPKGKKAEGGIVAYVARAEGDEEVYVAHIDGKGRKVGKSSRVTNAKGPASDVALTALPDGGYVLGWVEARNGGAPAVYTVRLDKSGEKAGKESKIGGGVAGDVADLSLVTLGAGAAGSKVVALWSDARDDASKGYADIYYAILGGKDLSKPVLSERPLAKTKAHSHYPVLTARGDGGAVIAWVEDEPSANEFLESVGRPEWGARLARIDAQGAIVQSQTEVALDPALGKGVATGVGLDCPSGPSSCRLAISWATREGIALLATNVGAQTPAPARVVWSWFGAPSQEVAPAVVGSALYAAEDGLEKDDGRVRRLSLAW